MSANNASSGPANAAERDLVITRVFDAPRRLVFEAWAKPEHLARWYLEIVELERIAFQGTIHDDPGHKVWTTVTFDEHEGKTKLTLNQTYSFVSDATRGAPEGWRQSLDRLQEHVEMKR
jgi:uncharacterized protein YndB with AHSA1/START domain